MEGGNRTLRADAFRLWQGAPVLQDTMCFLGGLGIYEMDCRMVSGNVLTARFNLIVQVLSGDLKPRLRDVRC